MILIEWAESDRIFWREYPNREAADQAIRTLLTMPEVEYAEIVEEECNQ